jgi:hypothetical protein
MRSSQVPRRRFLLASVRALVSAGWGPQAADAPAGGISLGFSLYGMKRLSLNKALEACAKIGYTHVEFALNDGYSTAPTAFTAEARLRRSSCGH